MSKSVTFPCRGTSGRPGTLTIIVSKRGLTTIRWKPDRKAATLAAKARATTATGIMRKRKAI